MRDFRVGKPALVSSHLENSWPLPEPLEDLGCPLTPLIPHCHPQSLFLNSLEDQSQIALCRLCPFPHVGHYFRIFSVFWWWKSNPARLINILKSTSKRPSVMTERNEETPPHFLWTWSWAFCPQLDFWGWGHASPGDPPLRVSPQHCSVTWTMCPRTLPSPPSSWGHGGMEQPRGSCLESLQGVPWVQQPSLLSQPPMVLLSWWDTKDCPSWANRERFQRTLINEIRRTHSKPRGYNDK